MKQVKKRLLALVLAIVMAVGVMPITAATAQAAMDTITLGSPVWDGDRASYTFPNADAELSGDQKIVCVSVNQEGYFVPGYTVDDDAMKITGVELEGTDGFKYADKIEKGKRYTSITVTGTIAQENIINFLRQLEFHRNDVEDDREQTVTVVVSKVALDDKEKMAAMAVDGVIHYYRYVKFDDYKSENQWSSGKGTKTWYDAYNEAKSDEMKFNGMRGYLATITSPDEQFYLYQNLGGRLEAWLGGARTFTPKENKGAGFTFDAEKIKDDALLPGPVGGRDWNNKNLTAKKWYWMCGPEAGKSFYITGEDGTYSGGSSENADTPYAAWNGSEPNNNYPGGEKDTDVYLQEYALEYGYAENAKWNDYSPYNVTRGNYGIQGYIIEYSPYTIKNAAGEPVEVIEPAGGSTVTDSKVIAVTGVAAIKAKDFVIEATDQKGFTDILAKQLAEVTASDVNEKTGKELSFDWNSSEITVNDLDVAKVVDPTEREVEMHYTYQRKDDTKKATTTATARIVDIKKSGTGTTGKSVTIGADEITVGIDKIAGKNNDDPTLKALLKTLGNPVAVEDGTKVLSSKINVKEVKLFTGGGTLEENPTVTFEYDGVTVTVPITVQTPSIGAHDFIVELGDLPQNPGRDDVVGWSDAERYTSPEQTKGDANSVGVDDTSLNELKDKKTNGTPGEVSVTLKDTSDSETKAADKIVTAFVVNERAESDNGDIEIGANDFSVKLKDIKGKSNSALNKLVTARANPVAIDKGENVSSEITVKEKNLLDSTGTPVDNPTVTFEYNGVDVTVKVNIIEYPYIEANDFFIKKNDGSNPITDDDIKENSDAKRLTGPGISDGNIEVEDADIEDLNEAEAGDEIHVTLMDTNKDGAPPESITVTVVDEVGKNGTDKIGANHFSLTVAEAENIQKNPDSPESQKLAKDYAKAIAAKNGVIIENTDAIQAGLTKIRGTYGTYEVTFSYGEATVKVIATVSGVSGNDFIVSTEEAEKAKPEDVLEYADAKADDDKPVTPDPADIAELNNKGKTPEPGTVPITLSAGNLGKKDVTATVVDEVDRGTGTDGNELVLGANHFNLSIAQAQAYVNGSADDVIKVLANAVATDAGTQVNRSDIKVDKANTNIVPENGIYNVTFTYKNRTVTVKATVKDDGAAGNTAPSTNLTANDFSVPAGSQPLTEGSFKEKENADVSANKNDGSKVPATVDPGDLEALNTAITDGKKGEYPVKVTAGGITTTVTVTVTDVGGDKGADGDKPGEHIGANNFIIGTDDIPLLTPDNVLKLSNAEAYETDTKKDVPVTTVDLSQVGNVPGTYPITLSTDNGTTTTIQVTIDDNWLTIGDVDKASDANKDKTSVDQDKAVPAGADKPGDTVGVDKVYEISNPKDVTQDVDAGREVDKVNIDGVDLPPEAWTSDGTTLTISNSAMQGKKEGTYPVVVTYKDGSKRTFNIKVVAYDETTVVKKVPTFNMQKDIGVGKKFKLNLVGRDANAVPQFKTSNKKIATVDSKGVIKAKKKGKCTITASVIQNGSYYTVKIKLIVKKSMKMYNLKNAALVKQQGVLPEFNVYKRVVKGKKTKLKFTNVTKDAKVTYTTSNKKVATISKKGVIKGKKKGFAKITAKIEQNGYTYYTRLFVRVDDGTKNKQLKKYLK